MTSINLSLEPWSYLIRGLNTEYRPMATFMLSWAFKRSLYVTEEDLETMLLSRYIEVPSKEYLGFAAYLSGLLQRYERVPLCRPRFLICDDETHLAELYNEELTRGYMGLKWGNKYVDKMLKFLRKR